MLCTVSDPPKYILLESFSTTATNDMYHNKNQLSIRQHRQQI